VYPEAKPHIRESIVDDHANYLDRRLREGCRSSTRLWRELQSWVFADRSTACGTGFGSAAATGPEVQIHHNDRLFAPRYDSSYGLYSKPRPPRRTFSQRCTGTHPRSARSQSFPSASSVCSANTAWRRGMAGSRTWYRAGRLRRWPRTRHRRRPRSS
jgi:hypothetical protein